MKDITYPYSSTIFIENHSHVNLPDAEFSKKIPDWHWICKMNYSILLSAFENEGPDGSSRLKIDKCLQPDTTSIGAQILRCAQSRTEQHDHIARVGSMNVGLDSFSLPTDLYKLWSIWTLSSRLAWRWWSGEILQWRTCTHGAHSWARSRLLDTADGIGYSIGLNKLIKSRLVIGKCSI